MSHDYTSKLERELELSTTDEIRILIADDQSFVRQFLELVFEAGTEYRFKVVGTANNGQQALKQIELLDPHVVVMDVEMPEMSGISAIQTITKQYPNCKVLIFSSHDDDYYLNEALQAGAYGYLLKTTPGEELRNAIANIYKGYYQVGPGLLKKALTVNNTSIRAIEKAVVSEETDLDLELELPTLNDDSAIEQRWSGSTQELLNTLPRVWSRGLIYLLIGFIAVGLPWTILARIDETGTARGKIEPQGKTFQLDTAVSGQVAKVHAKEGQEVKAGEKLLTIESEAVASALQQEQEKLKGQKNQLKELESIENQILQSLDAQKQQNQAQKLEKQAQLEQARQDTKSLTATYSSQKREKQAQLEQARKVIQTNQAAYELAQIRLQSAREKVPRYRQAFEDGAISQDRLLETTQLAKEAEQELKKSKLELQQSRSRLKEIQSSYQTLVEQETAEKKQAQLRIFEQQGGYNSLLHTNDLALLQNQEKIKDIDAQIANLKGEIAQTKSEIASLKFQLTQYTIEATTSGTVFQLPIQNKGANVQSGDTVATIAQTENSPYATLESNLVLRAKMPSSQTAFLKTGLPAKVKLDAYPFQDYGVVEGKVSWISPDSKVENEPQPSGEGEFFELEISLDRNYLEAQPESIPLTPGQTATAEVVVRQRRLIDFFLDPFKKLQKGGIDL